MTFAYRNQRWKAAICLWVVPTYHATDSWRDTVPTCFCHNGNIAKYYRKREHELHAWSGDWLASSTYTIWWTAENDWATHAQALATFRLVRTNYSKIFRPLTKKFALTSRIGHLCHRFDSIAVLAGHCLKHVVDPTDDSMFCMLIYKQDAWEESGGGRTVPYIGTWLNR